MTETDTFCDVDRENMDEGAFEDQTMFEEHFDEIECGLCPEGMRLQALLTDHLQAYHLKGNDINFDYERLQCCTCKEGLKLQVELVNHLLSHTQCLPCEMLEETSLSSQPEITTESPDEKHSRKPSYHSKFNRRERSPGTTQLLIEFTQDSATRMFHCNFCRNGYKQKQSVERHLLKEHDSKKLHQDVNYYSLEPETKTFFCGLCESTFKIKRSMESHLLKEHSIAPFKGKAAPLKLESEKSIKLTKNSKSKTLVCDFCGQSFTFRESLRKHLNRHVSASLKTSKTKRIQEKIVCDQCTKLVNPHQMRRHILTNHSDYRPYKCQEPGCTTSYFDANKFRDHMNIHNNIKPHICEFCDEGFHYASNLRQHKLRHTNPDRYKCEECHQCLVSSKSLQFHMRLHNSDPDASKPFECSFEGCNKAFRYEDRLKLHKTNVHRTEPDYSCEICKFVTHKKKYFKRHQAKVHNIREGNPRARVFPISRIDV